MEKFEGRQEGRCYLPGRSRYGVRLWLLWSYQGKGSLLRLTPVLGDNPLKKGEGL